MSLWVVLLPLLAVSLLLVLFIYLFIFFAPNVLSSRGLKIKKRIERVWNGHGADSEIGKFIYLFIYLLVEH